MVIHYRNQFLKVFGLSILLFLIVIIYLLTIELQIENGLYNKIIFQIIWIVGVVAWILYVWSHYLLAKAKGYSAWLTLLALINTIGLAILFLLPDKRKNQVPLQ